VLNILRNELFAHVPNEPQARAMYLAEMVRAVIKSSNRLIPNTDRDDIRNQRLLTTGTLLRDLFAAVWKDWSKKVSLAIDNQYNYNKTLYEGDKFFDLFSAGNRHTIFQANNLNVALMKGFRGRWGTTAQNTKTGVLQPVARISYFDAMSHCRRILLDFDTSLKQKGPRQLHPSQIGYFCTNETPTGAHIGVSKNYSMMTYVSIAAPIKPIIDWLVNKGGMVKIADATQLLRANGTLVKINGGTVGFVSSPLGLVRVLKLLKWTACLSPLASISHNTLEHEIRIYIDEGRPCRPLWHLEANGAWTAPALNLHKNHEVVPVWRDLVMGNFSMTKHRRITDVEFIDPLESNPNAKLEDYNALLYPHISAIEYVDPYESNEAFITWWGMSDINAQHTHVEIHPSTMLGLMVSLIPFCNHNQSPRNQLSCSQSKQGIGYYATNYLQRYDTYGSQLCYGEAPLARPMVYDHVGRGQVPYGYNCIVAMASTDGYNQDDGILFNKSSVERGMFRSLALRSYEALEEVDTMSKVEYKIANPKLVSAWTDLRPGYDYSKLDESGIIREGETIEDHTILVGRYMEHPETHLIRDASTMPTVFTGGRVESVVVLNQANGKRLVRIRILQERIPELGDKFGSRHGQKGTMGMIIPAENMPHTKEGIIPDVIVNPHGLTSRMTVAQLIECLFGKYGAEIGAKCNATPFANRDDIVKTIGNSLMDIGMNPYAENLMYCGTTGKQLPCSIFMGPIYFMRMKHLTMDKMNSRAEGRREMRTHQPTGGRGNEGGMRIGEMERDAISAHGVSLFLQESMMKRADATHFHICNGCGTIPIYNEKENLFVCPTCDGPVEFSGSTGENLALIQPLRRSRVTFSKVEIPYALKLLDQELTTYMGAGLRYVTERSVGRLRDSVLEWSQKGAGERFPGETEYTKLALAGQDLQQTKLANEKNTLEGPPERQEYAPASVGGDYSEDFEDLDAQEGGALDSAPVDSIGKDPKPMVQQDYIKQHGGDLDDLAPVDSIGKDPKPMVQQDYIRLLQEGGDLDASVESIGKDPKPMPQQDYIKQHGGVAPVNSIGKDPVPVKHDLEEEWVLPTQTGGMAPVDSIGKDPVPLKHDLEEEWVLPTQKGGAHEVQPTPPSGIEQPQMLKDVLGTEINQSLFSMASMDKPPYVIANPYVSPPLEQGVSMHSAPTVGTEVVEPTVNQQVAPDLVSEVAKSVQQGGGKQVINIYENDEIRVVKLQ
jgi:DNA-directed RNA polymerase II subunit RPB2